MVRVGDDRAWIEARPPDHLGLSLLYGLDYGHGNSIGCQDIELAVTPESFRCRLAPARTFLLREEADWLRSRGLGKRVSYRDVLVFDEHGPIEQLACGSPTNACGTRPWISSATWPWQAATSSGRFIAYRSGHRLNAELVRASWKLPATGSTGNQPTRRGRYVRLLRGATSRP